MHDAKNTRYLLLYVLCFLLSVLLLFLDSRGILEFLHAGVNKFAVPVQAKLFIFRQTLFFPFTVFEDKKKLVEKINLLEKEKAELLEKVGQLGALKEENESMRRLLGASLPPAWHFEPARVIYESSGTVYLTSSYKPSPDTAVVAQENNVFIGRTKAVSGGKIEVLLPTNTNSKIKVLVRDKNTGEQKASGIIEGRGGKALLTQVLQSEAAKEGDLILTSGDSGLPPNLLVGYVGKIFSNPQRAWQEAEVEMPINIKSLKIVFFVTKY